MRSRSSVGRKDWRLVRTSHAALCVLLAGSPRGLVAIRSMAQALTVRDRDQKAEVSAAERFEAQGNAAAAETHWRAALAIDPDLTIALDHLSTQLLRQRDNLGVIALLKPRDPATRSIPQTLTLSEALAVMARLQDAIEVLQAGLRQSPSTSPMVDELAAVYLLSNEAGKADALLEAFLAHSPNDKPTELLYLRSLITNGSGKAARVAQSLEMKYPNDLEILSLVAQQAWKDGDKVRARQLAMRVVGANPADVAAQKLAGDILLHEGALSDAKEHFQAAIRYGSAEPELHYRLAQVLQKLGDTTTAGKEIQAYKELHKASTDKIGAAEAVEKADRLLASGDAAQAVDLYKQAVELQPDQALVHFKLSVALAKQQDIIEERRELQRTIQLAPHLAEAYNQLGFLEERSGHWSDAERDFTNAITASPSYIVAWTNLAATLLSQSKLQQARDAVDHALRLDPGNHVAQRIDQLLREPDARP